MNEVTLVEKKNNPTAEMKQSTKRFLAMLLAVLMMFTNLGDFALGVVALADEMSVPVQIPFVVEMDELQQKLDAIMGEDGEPVSYVLPSYGESEEAAALNEALEEDVSQWLSGKVLLDAVSYEEDEHLLALVAAVVETSEEANNILELSVRMINTGSQSYSFTTSVAGTQLEAAELTLGQVVAADLNVGASDLPLGASDLPVGASSLNFTAQVKSSTVQLDDGDLSKLTSAKSTMFRMRTATTSGYDIPVGTSGIATLDIQPLSYDDNITITNHIVGDAPDGTTFTYQLYTGNSESEMELRYTFTVPANGSVTKSMGAWWGDKFKVVQTSPADINTYVAVGDARYYSKSNTSAVSTISDGVKVGFINAYSTNQAPSLSGDKTITARSEGGLYDITAKMEVQNGFEISDEPVQTPKPAQIILLLDLSNSMKYGMSASGSPELPDTNPEQRWYVTQEAAKSFITSILGNGNPANNEIAIIGFYSSGNDNISNVNNVTTLLSDYSSNIDTLLNSFYGKTLDSFRSSGNGGTNVQAGLRRAKNLLGSSTNDRTKQQFLVLMSDGAATSSISYSDKATIPGVDSDETDSRRAGWEANQIKSERPDVTICTVGIGNSTALGNTAKKTLEYIASNPVSDTYLLGENIEQLTARFNQLVTLISRYQFTPIKNSNVVLSDTMSQYVELVHADGTPITAQRPFTEADVVPMTWQPRP